MILYPAIDLLDGRVVRLHLGDFSDATDYGGDPAGEAARFAAAGAEWIHVVDLSGAKDGARRQTDLVKVIAAAGISVQTGGGVRTAVDVKQLLGAGAARVIVGSLSVTDPQTVIGWIDRFGAERIVAALDVRPDGAVYRPAIKGWTQSVEADLFDIMRDLADGGLRHALVTDISRDGALQGPNAALYRDLGDAFPDIALQASGGVSSLDDLRVLRDGGAAGAITGKALYEKRFSLEEALAACSQNG